MRRKAEEGETDRQLTVRLKQWDKEGKDKEEGTDGCGKPDRRKKPELGEGSREQKVPASPAITLSLNIPSPGSLWEHPCFCMQMEIQDSNMGSSSPAGSTSCI